MGKQWKQKNVVRIVIGKAMKTYNCRLDRQ